MITRWVPAPLNFQNRSKDSYLIDDHDINLGSVNVSQAITEIKNFCMKKYLEEKFPAYEEKCREKIENYQGRITQIENEAHQLKASENHWLNEAAKTFGRLIRSVTLVALCALGVITLIPLVLPMVSENFRGFLDRNISLKSHKQIELEDQWSKLGIEFEKDNELCNPMRSKICIATRDQITFKTVINLLSYLMHANPSDAEKAKEKAENYDKQFEEMKNTLEQKLFSLPSVTGKAA